jgi:hypothetical protein
MAEPWIVVPAVAGSSPVDHPTTVHRSRFPVGVTVCGSRGVGPMSQVGLSSEARDPLSEKALFLLHDAALERRELSGQSPTNPMGTDCQRPPIKF